MRKINFVFILFILFTSIVPTSCKKGPIQYKFDGIVNSSLDNDPVSGVAVTISQKIIQNGTTGESYSLAGSTTTDAAGAFAISFDREMVTEFLIEFEKENYFPLEIIESSSNISTENVNTFSDIIDPKSWVTFNIKNFLPHPDDHFRLVTHTFREGCAECAVNTTANFYGSVDTSFTYATTAGEYVRFTYIDVTYADSNLDSVYTVPFEDNTVTINY
ncbi:MAG: hypothetical protein GQ574_00815 [Crocinitomix sp.]|nr:hypothetical protein [Crocinitomix sp.]